ncbi:hypothetical protein [Nocardioides sp. KR10-350]|uniref:hypothetical protein n=1 Tax=Nocardioides cheoyonin TaxID=3156615 RepID=UPI0032B43B3A
MSDDYCELCDLPKSQCIHGRPPEPPPAPAKKAPPKPRAKPKKTTTPRASKAAVTSRPVQRRWTPPEALKPAILVTLQGAGGEMESEELFTELEAMLEERLLPGDRELTPEGEPRWRYAARRARQSLIAEGLMTKGAPGVWRLADRSGR